MTCFFGYCQHKGITTYTNLKLLQGFSNQLEFMTWIKGLRHIAEVKPCIKGLSIRIYDLNKGITTCRGLILYPTVRYIGLEFMTWIKGLRLTREINLLLSKSKIRIYDLLFLVTTNIKGLRRHMGHHQYRIQE